MDAGLKKLKQRYSDHIIEIIRLMLKFEETDRPSFIELAKLVLTSTENTIDSPKGKQPVGGSGSSQAIQKSIEAANQNKRVNKTFSNQNFKENQNPLNLNIDSQTASNQVINLNNRKDSKTGNPVGIEES